MEVQNRGFTIVRQLLTPGEVRCLAAELGSTSVAGQRGMLAFPAVRQIATSDAVLAAVRPYTQGSPRPVRAIYFDKSAERNWLVAWHQDLSISVNHQIEAPGFGPWSTKDGLIHVQPPAELLSQMITLRLHLDETDERNGALRLLPGSHVFGKLSSQDIERYRKSTKEEYCKAASGDALLMRPLILHASGRSTSDRPRRILHIEYAGFELPCGLRWNHAA